MDFIEKLKAISERYAQLKAQFSKEDIAYIANKDTPRGRMLGFLTSDYYRRESLIKEGSIVYGYTIRTYKIEQTMDRLYASWLLFSPSKTINEQPNILLNILENIERIQEKKTLTSQERQIKNSLTGDLSEPKYLEIPSPYNEGHLVYLQYCEVKPHHTPNLNLGLNFIIIAPAKSKEVIYLPNRYFHDVFKDDYRV